jgi:integrase
MGVRVKEWKGSWWLFVNHNGRRRAKHVGDKKAAELAATKIRAKLVDGDLSVLDPPPAAVPTFAEYAERWLTNVATIRCQSSTLEQYRVRVRLRLLPHLGPLPLTAVTRERIKATLAAEIKAGTHRHRKRPATTTEPVSASTVRQALFTLCAILNSAVEDGLIQNNPAARFGRLAKTGETEVAQIEVFRPAELRSVLEEAARDYPAVHPFILTLARTGLRLGEAIALQWADVDFAARTILVRRSRRRGQTRMTKNGKARRVDMSRQLCDALRGWQTLQQAEAAVHGRELDSWVFPALAGSAGDQDGFRRVWTSILRLAGVRYRKPHTLRHTYASLLIQAGEPLTYVQQQLGHHSAAFTLTVYGHYLPRADHRAVDGLDDVTGRNPGATEAEPHVTTMQRGR